MHAPMTFSKLRRMGSLMMEWPHPLCGAVQARRGDRGRSQVRGDGGGTALSCRTVEPAASPGAEDEKAASLVAAEFGVSAVTLAPGSSIDRAAWQGETIGDDLDAPFIRDRHVEVHFCQPDIAGDPGAAFTANARDGMLERQRALISIRVKVVTQYTKRSRARSDMWPRHSPKFVQLLTFSSNSVLGLGPWC
eukprot:s2756_g8.t1